MGIDFGVTKCAKLVVRRGKVSEAEGIKLPDGRETRNLEEGTSYKYLGMLEADEFQWDKMKKDPDQGISQGSPKIVTV